jgi:hypothetical protein
MWVSTMQGGTTHFDGHKEARKSEGTETWIEKAHTVAAITGDPLAPGHVGVDIKKRS